MYTKRKIAALIRVAADVMNISQFSLSYRSQARKDCNKQIPKGWVAVTPVRTEIGTSGDDFVGDMLSIVASRFVMRGPRILANRYRYRHGLGYRYNYNKPTKNLVKSKRSSNFG